MKLLVVLAFVAVTVATVSASVDIKTWRQTIKHLKKSPSGKTHTLDKYSRPARGCTVEEMTNADRALVTKVHNDLRRKVALGQESRGSPGPQPKAKNMVKMEYDQNLEKVAMAWASQCPSGHDGYRDIDGFNFVGQNHYKGGTTGTLAKIDWTHITTAWYDEVEDMDGNAATKPWSGSNPNLPTKAVGHYAQVIRAEAKKLGCASATFREKRMSTSGLATWSMRVAICNYGDGVFVQVPLYEAGEPCAGVSSSKCDHGLVIA